MSGNSNEFNKGDLVRLSNMAVNRYICEMIGIDVIDRFGKVDYVQLKEDFIEKCVFIDDLIIVMKYFPIWHKLN